MLVIAMAIGLAAALVGAWWTVLAMAILAAGQVYAVVRGPNRSTTWFSKAPDDY